MTNMAVTSIGQNDSANEKSSQKRRPVSQWKQGRSKMHKITFSAN